MKHCLACLALLATALAVGGGCASTRPSRHYVLQALPPETPPAPSGGAVTATVTLAAVRLADHLTSLRLPIRGGSNEIRYREYERWAGTPERNVEAVLYENLASRLAGRARLAGPTDPAPGSGLTLTVEVLDLAGMPGGMATLKARALLFRREDRQLLDTWIAEQETPAGASSAEWVAAQSANLARFADDLARRIQPRL